MIKSTSCSGSATEREIEEGRMSSRAVLVQEMQVTKDWDQLARLPRRKCGHGDVIVLLRV